VHVLAVVWGPAIAGADFFRRSITDIAQSTLVKG
jgi:hypothetical protein